MKKERFPQDASLTDEIAGIIRERILDGTYTIGEKISEAPLSNELRVSRTPIRHAFQQLAQEGLVEMIPNRGTFARGFTKRDVQDIYEVRKALEALAVEWAVSRIREEELEALQEIIDRMEFYTLKQNYQRVMEANQEFHETIYRASRSRFLSQILKSYQEYVQQARKKTVQEPEYLESILEEHKKILKALEEKDAKAAMRLVNQHLENSRKRAEAKWKGLSSL